MSDVKKDKTKKVKDDVVLDNAPVIERTETIMPSSKCKICAGKGWYNFLPPGKCGVEKFETKKGHRRERLHPLERRPCDCLNKQYRKLNPGVKPKFSDADGKVFITLEFLAKEKDVASGDAEDLKAVVETLVANECEA